MTPNNPHQILYGIPWPIVVDYIPSDLTMTGRGILGAHMRYFSGRYIVRHHLLPRKVLEKPKVLRLASNLCFRMSYSKSAFLFNFHCLLFWESYDREKLK